MSLSPCRFKPKTIKLVFAASPKQTAVGSYSKDWLDQNQEMCLIVFGESNFQENNHKNMKVISIRLRCLALTLLL